MLFEALKKELDELQRFLIDLKHSFKKTASMTIKERVQEVFNRFNVNLEVEDKVRVDLAEAALENGTVIYTDADSFVEGAEAYIINDEGERIPLPPGDYTLGRWRNISIGDIGKINKVQKPVSDGKGGDGKGADGKACWRP